MQETKVQYYERPETEHHQDFIQQHCHCILCGSVLEFQHMVDGVDNQIKEEARCPECQIRTRSKIHPLN